MKRQDVQQIFKSLPAELLAQIGEQTQVDHNVSRLYGERMLKLLILAMLRSDKISTHTLAYLYDTPFFNALSGKGDHSTRHSSIASRLSTMKPEYFKQLFEWCIAHFGKLIPAKTPLLKKIKRFDSTMVSISSALVDWGMRVGRPPQKGHQQVQLKFTMGLHASLPSSLKTFFDQAHLAEETALKEAIQGANLKKGDIAVFDKGLKSRKTLKVFDEQGIHFVTRGSLNIRYEILELHKKIKGRKADGLKFIQDTKVYLYTNGHQALEHPFRLIEVEDLQTGKTLFFITNIWDLTARQIAQIYRARWDIEVFFRFLKQQLSIKHLINRTENGVQIQIYAALITAMMLLVFKISNKISSYKIAKMKFEDDLLILLFKELQLKPPT